MTIAGGRVLLGALVLLVGVGCSAGDEPASDGSPSGGAAPTTVAASTTSTRADESLPEDDAPLPEDAVWVLGDPDLTFVRADERGLPGGGPASDVPFVSGSLLLLQYRTPGGGTVFVEQKEIAGADGASGSFALEDGRPVAVAPGGGGLGPTLTTIAGRSRVAIRAPEEDLRPLARTLEPVTRAELDEMVHTVAEAVIAQGEAEPVVDGITFHGEPGTDPVACLDGEEPQGCANVGRYGPLVMAPIPRDGTYVVVGCISQPIPVTEVVVDGQPIPTRTATCGQAFSMPGVAPGTLAIAFDDGPGGVGTFTFDLP